MPQSGKNEIVVRQWLIGRELLRNNWYSDSINGYIIYVEPIVKANGYLTISERLAT